ncbi:Rap1-interacting factor 1 N terminal-domain-containing protein [Stachybotrys elegans]|uniref:Rap1-interacting factor 1 N terminal-domain-containing protein n=1 Tax=Stachybotrys elegans TaxID=80388 RepID=A0A8K0T072_9HYPO|nr:Rap1-interacting factor 1 N terminal-domain-containing protein [Stachybotrys elegans]
MASSAVGPTLIQSLPARPPTPPREARPGESSIKTRLNNRPLHFESRSSLHTPPNAVTPSLSVASDSNPSSTRVRKKVGWSATTQYKEAPQYLDGENLSKSSPLSVPSSSAVKPIKGILKPSSSPNSLATPLAGQSHGSASQATISEMLDSTIKQLAGSDRDSKIDSYMMLARALKASNNLPDRVALQNKMSLFMQFIQRDVVSKNDKGTLDTSLVNHALTLLITFVHFPAIASTLTSDFGAFVIDHAIRSFEDPSLPKDVARHLMQVVAFQNFSAKVMTADRVGKLIQALHNIESYAKGKSIIMCRVHIYKRLLQQSRSHMAVHSDWLKDLFTDMLSTVQEIRNQAISLGLDAGYNLRSDKHVTRKVTDILQTTNEDQVYIEFYIKRLEEMTKDKQLSSAVPQIWSVVILFMRCPLERWQYYGPWFRIAQSTFNMSDALTKQEANYAWCRYAYLSLSDAKPSAKSISTLCQPLLSQLRRKASSKQAEESMMKLRKLVIGGVCNLLYYTFKPGDDKTSPDVAWDVVVQPIASQLITLDGQPGVPGDGLNQASRILIGLLDVATPRVWREDRIVEIPPPTPDELPSIDSKWVRRNSARILQVAGPILERKFQNLADIESKTYRLWRVWVGSVVAASAKDIKVSDDTTQFLACALELLRKIWATGPHSNEENVCLTFFTSVKNFIQILVDGLGLLPFTEKKLNLTVSNTLEPISTSSHHQDRADDVLGAIRSPLTHLFMTLSVSSIEKVDQDIFARFLESIVELFFKGKSARIQFTFGKELLQLYPRDNSGAFGSWVLVADMMRPALTRTPLTSTPSPSIANKLLGPDYKDAVSLLQLGLSLNPPLAETRWMNFFNLLSENVLQDFGDAGRALAIVEPLSKGIVERLRTDSLKISSLVLTAVGSLFEIARMPRDRQAVEAARRRLWNNPMSAGRNGSFDPFDQLYKLENQVLQTCYQSFEHLGHVANMSIVLERLGLFLSRSFTQVGVESLIKLQSGLCIWLQDGDSRLRLTENSPVSEMLGQTWDRICADLSRNGRMEAETRSQIEPLLVAALTSKHAPIVSTAMDMLNATLDDTDADSCSEMLKSAISSLRSQSQPAIDTEQGFGAQTTMSHDCVGFDLTTASSSKDIEQTRTSVPSSRASSRNRSSKKRRAEPTADIGRTRQARRTSTPRLRHDNSQIQFAPVVSSPPPLSNEESQHLTERQKEVRERQRENAAMYTELQVTSPEQQPKAQTGEQAQERPNESDAGQQKSTPTKTASYEQMISSTPTPRRGQVLQIDELNDPPSSPPETGSRSHRLLSELQSRSRKNSSLNNWEFSSPPGSPLPSRQQVPADQDSLSLITSIESSVPGVTTRSRSSPLVKATAPQTIPSSFDSGDYEGAANPSASGLASVHRLRQTQTLAPATPKRQTRSVTKLQETPKSVDDEFVDARSSPEQASPAQGADAAQTLPDHIPPTLDSEDSGTSRLVVELAPRMSREPASELDSSPEKTVSKNPAEECILVQGESSPSPLPTPLQPLRRTRSSARQASPPPPSQTTEVEVDENSQGKKKRKRSGAKESRRKKRRSETQDSSQMVEELDAETEEGSNKPLDSQVSEDATPSQQVVGVVTRRGARKQQDQDDTEDTTPQDKDIKIKDDGDTDEEVMSQLVSESQAATHSQSEMELDEKPPSTVDDSMASAPRSNAKSRRKAKRARREAAAKKSRQSSEERQNEKASNILGALQGGLAELRVAALSREDVYKIEDMLMDMKRELFEAERRGRAG